jgi:hypothetical protein
VVDGEGFYDNIDGGEDVGEAYPGVHVPGRLYSIL